MMQLIDLFNEHNYQITFATTATQTAYSAELESINVDVQHIVLNDSSFDLFIKELNPDVVLFDRFNIEEQFGWRVSENCPETLRILDTEDLHFLRKARADAFKKNEAVNLYSETAKRELASILRSDLSLIVSAFEMQLLQELFSIPEGLLYYLPLFVESPLAELPPFEERRHFVTIGNFQHAPNADSVVYLKKELWPLMKEEFPESEIHIYGAYAPKYISEMHNPKEGFFIEGWAEDVSVVMKNARVCLAPLRFGAGIKGKLLAAAQYGTPSVTTGIGGEGMFELSIQEEAPKQFIKRACSLYRQQDLWSHQQHLAFGVLKSNFRKEHLAPAFTERIFELRQELANHRKTFFISQIMQHETLKATKYLSKWIEAKNK